MKARKFLLLYAVFIGKGFAVQNNPELIPIDLGSPLKFYKAAEKSDLIVKKSFSLSDKSYFFSKSKYFTDFCINRNVKLDPESLAIGYLKDQEPKVVFTKANYKVLKLQDRGSLDLETRVNVYFSDDSNSANKKQSLVFPNENFWHIFRDSIVLEKTGRYGLAFYENSSLSEHRFYIIDYHSSDQIMRLETFLQYKLSYQKKNSTTKKQSENYQMLED